MQRRGSTFGAVVVAAAGIGLAGVVGYMGVTGTTPCSLMGTCSVGSGEVSTTTLVAASTSETPACNTAAACPHGASVETVASTDETTKSCCALKALAAKETDSKSQEAAPTLKTSKAPVAQVAATTSKPKPTSYIDRRGRRVRYTKVRMNTLQERITATSPVLVKPVDGKSMTPPKTTNGQAVPSAPAPVKETSKANVVNAAALAQAQCSKSASACSGVQVCTKTMAASERVAIDLVASGMPIVVPAAFYQAEGSIDRDTLTDAGCCRSGLTNVSATKLCSKPDTSACCSKGKTAVIPAAAVEKAACSKGDACCKNKGAVAVTPAAAVEKAACSKGDACCKNKGTVAVIPAAAVEKAACSKGDACCKNKNQAPASE